MTDLAFCSIAEAATLLEAGEVSARELISAALDQVDRHDHALHAFATVFGDSARARAGRVDTEPRSGRLRGIPVAVKDNLAVRDQPMTNGSRVMQGFVPDFDAAVVERASEAGAVVVGKNTMHEWAMGGTCTGGPAGTVRNPWDPARVPGGSTGGGAVAVSVGMATLAIGTDGMGSIRTPASYCGVVGLKPTAGRVSRWGQLPMTASRSDQVGFLARRVSDVSTALEVMTGHDRRDPTSLPKPEVPGADVPSGLRQLRVAVVKSYLLDDAVPAVLRGVDDAAGRLEGLGCLVDEIAIPALEDIPLTMLGAAPEIQSALLPYAIGAPDAFGAPEIRMRILAAEFVSERAAGKARQLRQRVCARLVAVFDRHDIVLSATNPTPAFGIGAAAVDTGIGSLPMTSRGAQKRLTTRATVPWNIAGTPAISIPSALTADGLPIGIQLVAAPWHDELLLHVAGRLEAEFGPYRRPPLCETGVRTAGDRHAA